MSQISQNPPPSNRSQAMYCRVVIEGCAMEQVAKEFNVRLQRLKIVIAEVKRWLRRTPGTLEHANKCETGRVLLDLHLARLEHQWEQLMLAWYRSTQAEETEKVIGDEKGQRKAEKIRRTQTGDVKYLEHAREIMAEMRRLSMSEAPNSTAQEQEHVESLTLEQRQAALDCLLETLGRRAREAEAGGTDSGQNAAA